MRFVAVPAVLAFVWAIVAQSANVAQASVKYPSLQMVARQTLAAHFGLSDNQTLSNQQDKQNHQDPQIQEDQHYASLDDFAKSFAVAPKYRRSAGLFVTFSKNGKTRACWGSIYPACTDLVKGTVYATEEALNKDFRFHKIKSSECSSLKAQVTVIDSIVPISSITGQDAMHYGLFVRQGGKTALLLPGEAQDAHYQLVQCKLKAGIQTNEPCQMYRINAHVYN